MSHKDADRYTDLVHLFKRLRSALGAIYRDNLKDIVISEITKGVETAESFAKQQRGKREQRAKKRA